jgi:hypothetical protein
MESKNEERNVGSYEAILRGIIGASFLAMGLSRRNPAWLLSSGAFFWTAFSRQCKINSAFDVKRSWSSIPENPTIRDFSTTPLEPREVDQTDRSSTLTHLQ